MQRWQQINGSFRIVHHIYTQVLAGAVKMKVSSYTVSLDKAQDFTSQTDVTEPSYPEKKLRSLS